MEMSSDTGQAFPTRTEGSVKKHWYKVGDELGWDEIFAYMLQDMHYAEFAEVEVSGWRDPEISQPIYTPSQSIALREAIREYEANKWKVIGQKVGKPAKVRISLPSIYDRRG